MTIVQLVLVAGGLMALMIVGYVIMSGKSPGKEGQRRLQAVRYRHSDSTVDKVESQLKKAIAAPVLRYRMAVIARAIPSEA